MSTLKTYLDKKAELELLLSEVTNLENSDELKMDVEFKEKISELLETYEKTAKDALNILSYIDPSILQDKSDKNTREPRQLMTYKNPHTGEVVQTKGGNHKTLKQWRQQYGKEAVNDWKS